MRTHKLLTVSAAILMAGVLSTPLQAQDAGMSGIPIPKSAAGQGYANPGVAAVPANTGAPLPGMSPNAASARPTAYQDPKRGFMLVAPQGAQFQERAEGGQISIQSPKGYALNLQTGDANPTFPTINMFAKLEQKYLGEGKPWARKLGQEEAVIAGLPAGVAYYEAGATRSKVVIARGKSTDFVFMFFAPTTHFEKLDAEFNWILASFRPAPSEKPDTPAVVQQKPKEEPKQAPLRAQNEPEPIPAGRPAPKLAAPPSDMMAFAEPGYGYQVSYPKEWQLEKVTAFTNVFSGPKGTPAYDAIVSLQNVKPSGEANQAAMIAFEDLKTKLSRQAKQVDFYGEKTVTYAKHGLQLEGRQFVATYDHNGQRFQKWVLVLPRPEGAIAHIWSYTAPSRQFDTYRPVAERILNSLKIDG